MELCLEEAKNHVLVCHEKYEYNEVAGSPVSIDMLPLDTDETYRNVYSCCEQYLQHWYRDA